MIKNLNEWTKMNEKKHILHKTFVDAIEGTPDVKDLKMLKEVLRKLTSEWLAEGFDIEEIMLYLEQEIVSR